MKIFLTIFPVVNIKFFVIINDNRKTNISIISIIVSLEDDSPVSKNNIFSVMAGAVRLTQLLNELQQYTGRILIK